MAAHQAAKRHFEEFSRAAEKDGRDADIRRDRPKDQFDVAIVREAIRRQRKLHLDHADEKGPVTRRVIRPFILAYSEDVRLIVAWCELRTGFRQFRTGRVRAAELLGPSPDRVTVLRRKWEQARRSVGE